jgi:hypothetical protein
MDPIQSQLALLNLRLTDLVAQLNVVVKTLTDEIALLRSKVVTQPAAPTAE